MKKLKMPLMLCTLFLMSSCVYSLFPIYTKDTMFYFASLEGTWRTDEASEDYIRFIPNTEIKGQASVDAANKKVTIKKQDVEIKTSYSFTFDDDEYILENGDTIRDKQKVEGYYKGQLDSIFTELAADTGELAIGLSKFADGLSRMTRNLSNIMTPLTFAADDMSYLMEVKNGDGLFRYEMVITKIGEDYFMDIYPSDEDASLANVSSMVWFPVHSFMKMEMKNGQLLLSSFNLKKMKRLFESNLVRMRHEIVDGSVLLTAKTDEIRKFLERYSNDETVFESTEVYSKVEQE